MVANQRSQWPQLTQLPICHPKLKNRQISQALPAIVIYKSNLNVLLRVGNIADHISPPGVPQSKEPRATTVASAVSEDHGVGTHPESCAKDSATRARTWRRERTGQWTHIRRIQPKTAPSIPAAMKTMKRVIRVGANIPARRKARPNKGVAKTLSTAIPDQASRAECLSVSCEAT